MSSGSDKGEWGLKYQVEEFVFNSVFLVFVLQKFGGRKAQLFFDLAVNGHKLEVVKLPDGRAI